MICVPITPLLLHDNTPAHKVVVSEIALGDFGFDELSHGPCSPHVAPCDFRLFPSLKRHLLGKHFDDDNQIRQRQKSGYMGKTKHFI